MADPVRSPFSRVFTIEDRAGPSHVPLYQGQARAMGPSWAFGDRTPIREPDPDRYGAFIIIDAIKAERELPQLTIENRYQYTISAFLEFGRRGCPLDVQVHFGKCQDPRDFNGGWDKILSLDAADLTNWSTNEMGALEQGQDALVNETIDMDGFDMYEIKQLAFSTLAAAEVVQEVVDLVICDAISCGACGIASTGCQTVFGIQLSAGGSPGLPAEVIFTQDSGATWGETNIITLPAGSEPDAVACVGTRLAVAAATDDAIHYATLDLILLGTEVWVRNASGITATFGPLCLFNAGAAFTWAGGEGGKIYFWSDITAAAVVQDDSNIGSADYRAIHGLDDQVVVAVGDGNQIGRTLNGGETWSALTGPAPTDALLAVAVKGTEEYMVGTDDGELFYTLDGGATWTLKAFPGSGVGGDRIDDIVFATKTIGYMSHDTGGAGRILRTIDGGNSWYVLPEGTGTIPANVRINALDACGEDVNLVYGGGLAAASDGIVVKAA